ncbi:hypothetical protein [Natrinema gelatinilyticum]|uniref:hypothetical protein n=1 Tax=Natrinema gelatinilyticum TaxID=2961571 RepID=UPI0020C4CEB8|nr:hypothetical protein [Natrinema gelatinilyticum]
MYRDELVLDGHPVDIENLTILVLQIIGSFDHLIPPDANKPFTDVIPSEDTDIYEFLTGPRWDGRLREGSRGVVAPRCDVVL